MLAVGEEKKPARSITVLLSKSQIYEEEVSLRWIDGWQPLAESIMIVVPAVADSMPPA